MCCVKQLPALLKTRPPDFLFSATAQEVQSVPEPENNTNLAQALREVQRLDPGVTLVISDGQPDNARAALDVASTFRGAIDVLYIGNDKDYAAISRGGDF